MSNITQYTTDLEENLAKLESRVKELEEEIVQTKLKFELRKNDIQDEVSRELSDYEAQGLSLDFDFDEKNFKVSDENVNDCLKVMYKIV